MYPAMNVLKCMLAAVLNRSARRELKKNTVKLRVTLLKRM